MGTSKLRIQVEARAEAMRDWAAAVREAREALGSLNDEVQRSGGAVGGTRAGGGPHRDSPSPQGAGTNAPPKSMDDAKPSGATVSGDKEPESQKPRDRAQPRGDTLGGVAEMLGAGAAGGAAIGAAAGIVQGAMSGGPGRMVGSLGGAALGVGVGALTGGVGLIPGALGGAFLGGSAGGMIDSMVGGIGHAISSAVGFGIGQDPLSFVMGSGGKYLELSRAIQQVDARFRDAAGSAAFFGQSMGYTIDESSRLMTQLGSMSNYVTRRQSTRYLGFGRTLGIEQGTNLAALGGMQRYTGETIGGDALVQAAGLAARQDMSRGRMGEFLQAMEGVVQSIARSTGRLGPDLMTSAGGVMQLGTQVFGTNEFGRGSGGVDFANRLNATMTQGGTMRSYMLRAMGMGSAGGPGYREAMMQLEGGIFDSRNLPLLFRSMQSRGLGENEQFVALQQLSGGNMKAWEIDKLVREMNREGGLQRYEAAMQGDEDMREAFLADLDPRSRKAFEAAGFEGSGRRRISVGEGRAVRLEAIQMRLGKTMSEIMESSEKMFTDLIDAVTKWFPTLGDDLKFLGNKMSEMTSWLKESASPISSTPLENTAAGAIINQAPTVGALPALGVGARVLINRWMQSNRENE